MNKCEIFNFYKDKVMFLIITLFDVQLNENDNIKNFNIRNKTTFFEKKNLINNENFS